MFVAFVVEELLTEVQEELLAAVGQVSNSKIKQSSVIVFVSTAEDESTTSFLDHLELLTLVLCDRWMPYRASILQYRSNVSLKQSIVTP